MSLLHSFMRKRIEQEIKEAHSRVGMGVHDGRTRLLASDAQRMLDIIDFLEKEISSDARPL